MCLLFFLVSALTATTINMSQNGYSTTPIPNPQSVEFSIFFAIHNSIFILRFFCSCYLGAQIHVISFSSIPYYTKVRLISKMYLEQNSRSRFYAIQPQVGMCMCLDIFTFIGMLHLIITSYNKLTTNVCKLLTRLHTIPCRLFLQYKYF